MSEPVTVLAALFIKGTDRKLHTTVICILGSRDLPPSRLADGQSCHKGTASRRRRSHLEGGCFALGPSAPERHGSHLALALVTSLIVLKLGCFVVSPLPSSLPLIYSLIPGPDHKCLVMLSVLSWMCGPASLVSTTQSLL